MERFRAQGPAARLVHREFNAVAPLTPLREAFQPFPTRSGRLIARGAVVADWEDQLKVISAGLAVGAAGAEAAGFYPRPDLVNVPVRDAAPIRWDFAWRATDTNPLIRALATVGSGHRSGAAEEGEQALVGRGVGRCGDFGAEHAGAAVRVEVEAPQGRQQLFT